MEFFYKEMKIICLSVPEPYCQIDLRGTGSAEKLEFLNWKIILKDYGRTFLPQNQFLVNFYIK